jgi:hypothetical protein
MKAKGTYTPTKWDEKPYEQIGSQMKLTRASVVFAFTGQIEGNASVEYLMFYRYFDPKDPHKAVAQYIGLIRLDGKLNGKAGSFVMEDRGAYENGTATSSLKIASGSGTGELKGISGKGKYTATQKGSTCELDYELK